MVRLQLSGRDFIAAQVSVESDGVLCGAVLSRVVAAAAQLAAQRQHVLLQSGLEGGHVLHGRADKSEREGE